MIPTHKLVDEKVKEIRIVKFGSRAKYNIYEPHRHDYYELFFFNEGGGTHEIDFTPFTIEKNSIHYLTAGRVHQLTRALKSTGYVIIFHASVFYSYPIISQFLFDLDCFDVTEYSPTFTFDNETQKEILDAIKSISNNFDSNTEFKEQFILNKLSLICLHCLKNTKQKSIGSSKDQELYVQFRKELKQNYIHCKKVKTYSEKLGITARKLNNIVSLRTGLSVSGLIQRLIILEAKRLLNIGNSSKEIAYKLKFEDPAHFSKFFKKQTGSAPSVFQKNNQ